MKFSPVKRAFVVASISVAQYKLLLCKEEGQ